MFLRRLQAAQRRPVSSAASGGDGGDQPIRRRVTALRREVRIAGCDTPEWHGFSGAASVRRTALGDVVLQYKGEYRRLQRSSPAAATARASIPAAFRSAMLHVRSRRHVVHLVQHQRDLKARFPCRCGGAVLDDHAQSDRAVPIRRFGNHLHDHRSRVSDAHASPAPTDSVVLPAARAASVEEELQRLGKTNIYRRVLRRDGLRLRRRSPGRHLRRRRQLGRVVYRRELMGAGIARASITRRPDPLPRLSPRRAASSSCGSSTRAAANFAPDRPTRPRRISGRLLTGAESSTSDQQRRVCCRQTIPTLSSRIRAL